MLLRVMPQELAAEDKQRAADERSKAKAVGPAAREGGVTPQASAKPSKKPKQPLAASQVGLPARSRVLALAAGPAPVKCETHMACPLCPGNIPSYACCCMPTHALRCIPEVLKS